MGPAHAVSSRVADPIPNATENDFVVTAVTVV